MKDILEELGYSKNEILVYRALLELGSSTVGPITKHSKLYRSKAYEALERLIAKGLVSYHLHQNRKCFRAQDPSILLDQIEDKKDRLKQEVLRLQTLKPAPEEETMNILDGYHGIKSMYDEMLHNLPKNSTICILGASGGQYAGPKTWTAFYANFNKKRLAKKIAYKILWNKELKNSQIVKEHKEKLSENRFLDVKAKAGINIHGNKVAIILWKKIPKAFVIESSDVADSFRKYFEKMWKKTK